MRNLIVLVMILISFGCAKLEVSSPDGTRAYYTRCIFSQEIHGLKINKDTNGTVGVELESQKSDAAIVAEIAKELIPIINQYQTLMAITNAAALPAILSQGKK